MSNTFLASNGDLILDELGRLVMATDNPKLDEFVNMAIIRSFDINLLNVNSDPLIDIVESFITIRILNSLTELQATMDLRDVSRSDAERIQNINTVLVQKSKMDPRYYRFWVQITSWAYYELESLGNLGG